MLVPNKPLREAIQPKLDNGTLTLFKLAQWMGYASPGHGAENLSRSLGMVDDGSGLRKTMQYEKACEIYKAAHLDPWDAGL